MSWGYLGAEEDIWYQPRGTRCLLLSRSYLNIRLSKTRDKNQSWSLFQSLCRALFSSQLNPVSPARRDGPHIRGEVGELAVLVHGDPGLDCLPALHALHTVVQ